MPFGFDQMQVPAIRRIWIDTETRYIVIGISFLPELAIRATLVA